MYPCRSYYRCTNPRCNAKKQVERSIEDPDTLIITYEGLHLHYTYPFLMLNSPPIKKHKGPTSVPEAQLKAQEENGFGSPSPLVDPIKELEQGLLEAVVPLTIRKPFMDIATSSYSTSSTSHDISQPSSPSTYSSYLGLL